MARRLRSALFVGKLPSAEGCSEIGQSLWPTKLTNQCQTIWTSTPKFRQIRLIPNCQSGQSKCIPKNVYYLSALKGEVSGAFLQ